MKVQSKQIILLPTSNILHSHFNEGEPPSIGKSAKSNGQLHKTAFAICVTDIASAFAPKGCYWWKVTNGIGLL